MTESDANGPERKPSGFAESAKQSELEAECGRLREQVHQLAQEREQLQQALTSLKTDEEKLFYSMFRFVRDTLIDAETWTPPDESEWVDFAQVIEELEREYGQ